MTRLSSYLLPTLKDAPADAEAVSHKLMVRAGLIRQVGTGVWSYLPAGVRVLRKIETIIREEMEAIGGQEVLLPVMQPAELWRRTGRYDIDELFKLEDRKGSDLVLAMTNEEAITFHVANEVRSYRELPQILFQIQTKERDEPRPRAGVLRTREFSMKDAYSFDRDEAGLDESYEKHRVAYARIYDRCGLRWYEVASDVGMMGGTAAHEYMAPCEAGEDAVALAAGYAANIEVASADPQPVELPPALDAPREAPTPGAVDRRRGLRGARRSRRGPDQGDAGRRRRRPRPRHGPDPRRPPAQRGQAHQPPRRRLQAGPGGRDRRGDRPGRLHRPGRRRAARDQGRGDHRLRPRLRRQRRRRAPDRRRAGARLQLRGGRRPHRRDRRHERRRATRSRSSPRSRSATSSSSAPATRSRSARPTSTPTGPSSRS